jgi:uncharacterized protein HemX
MEPGKIKTPANIKMLAAAAVSLVVVMGLAAYAALEHTHNLALNQTVDDQASRLTKVKHELDSLKTVNADLQGKISAGQVRFNADAHTLEQLRGSVDAFAKQAASCESLRQRVSQMGSQS